MAGTIRFGLREELSVTTAPPIHEKQATPRGLLLQRAADGSHLLAHRIEMSRLAVSLLFGLAAVVATRWPDTAPMIAVSGATWAIFSFCVLAPWSQRETTTAALTQELFDTELFDIPWSPSLVDQPPAEEDLRRRARYSSLHEERMTTWYPEVGGIDHAYGILICQRENLSWDSRLRNRYATTLMCAIGGWTVIGLVVGVVTGLSVWELLIRWFAPSTAALLFAGQHARVNRELAYERRMLRDRVRQVLDSAGPGPLSKHHRNRLYDEARSIQDGIFRTRNHSERVPRWFYECFRSADEADMRETASDTVKRLRLLSSKGSQVGHSGSRVVEGCDLGAPEVPDGSADV